MPKDYLTERKGHWQFYRRVPKRYATVEPRPHLMLTTGIAVADDPKGVQAARVAAQINQHVEATWRLRTEGDNPKQSYADAVLVARKLGLDYLSPVEAAQKEINALLLRIETLVKDGRPDVEAIADKATRKAVLGGIAKPRVMLSDLLMEYEAASKSDMAAMSVNQLRKWRNAKKAAADHFVKVRGDKALSDLSRTDFTEYSDHWEARVIAGEINAGTANKAISHLTGMVRTVNRRMRLGLDPSIFTETRIAGGRDGKRATFTVENIRSILANGLDGLNDEAADIIRVVVETGARPGEIASLSPSRIRLDEPVPHIEIAADGRKTKTESSKRTIPLVGVALEAMRRHPSGFPRYNDKGDNLSAAVLKFWRSRDLLPTPDHTVYSLRHAFKDRLRAVEAPEEMVDALMGHSNPKPDYGNGYTLEAKRKFLRKIAMPTR
ncbi:tyrosine-type recombinase/integrase [Bradyrhizobium elkanii]|uniref:tyrosine-type recombinase/integrase n=1 Tax=Bradyrhizobium elkanii TaxID=29448 RepID=UPI00216A63D0|nr:tyrosine-type recombinase/integrase [Bradyrhizobium elkanii]MCS3689066.1 integrase [Bradyrhizobium elkanii]